MTAPAYRPHPGQPHEWSQPILQLAGNRACRNCGHLYPGLPTGPVHSGEDPSDMPGLKAIGEPYRACPRFDTCSVNLCPLDPEIGIRTVDPGDRETKCHLSRRVRRALFAELPAPAKAKLPFGGLYETEFRRSAAAKRVHAGLTEEQRAKQRAVLETGRAVLKRARTPNVSGVPFRGPTESPSGDPTPSKDHATGGEAA